MSDETNNVIKFPVVPRRLCAAYLDRAQNATVIIMPVRVERYDYAPWRHARNKQFDDGGAA